MERDKLKDLWERHFGFRPKGSGKWLKCKCPMAPYTEAHSNNVDSSPSLTISVDEEGISFARCYTCSEKPYPLLKFLDELVRFTQADSLIEDFADSENKETPRIGLLGRKKENKAEEAEDDKDYTETLAQFKLPPNKQFIESKGVDLATALKYGIRSNAEPAECAIELGIRRTGILIPYFALDGKTCVGIKYRPLVHTQGPKYWYPCPLSQTAHLYGSWFLPEIDEDTHVFLCEGELDVMHLSMIGLFGIACAGSSMSPLQANFLSSFTEKVYALPDPDGAGLKLAMQAKPLLAEYGVKCHSLHVLMTKDPKEMSKEEIMGLVSTVDSAQTFIRRGDSNDG